MNCTNYLFKPLFQALASWKDPIDPTFAEEDSTTEETSTSVSALEVKPSKRSLVSTKDSELPQKQVKIDKENSIENSIPIITNQMLMNRFKRGAILGRCLNDTTSIVFAVEDLKYNEGFSKVLKITDSVPPFEALSRIHAIWDSEESIHLTRTVLIGKIEVRTGSYLQIEHNCGEYVLPPRANQKQRRWAYVYCMPQKAGDLKALKAQGISIQEEAAIEVQRVALEALLNEKGVDPEDLKDINILTEPRKPEDRFQGRRIAVYDYLKYTIGSQSYFLPKGSHLITFCDYDKWRTTEEKKDFSHLLDERLKRAPHLLAEIEKFKITPAAPCRILTMN